MLDLVDAAGYCDDWVNTELAAFLYRMDYVDSAISFLFLGISLTQSDVLFFLLSLVLFVQEWFFRYPISLLIDIYGPQGSDCELYAQQLPCRWGQLLGVIVAFAVLLSLRKRAIPGQFTFFSCTFVAFVVLFAFLYRRIVGQAQMVASVFIGGVTGAVAFFLAAWFLNRFGDRFIVLPVVRWFAYENTLVGSSANAKPELVGFD